MLTMTAHSGYRSRSAAPGSTSAWVSASSNYATAVRKSGVSHSRGCSSTETSSILATEMSLFGAHSERQAGQALDDDRLAGIDSVRADGPPELPPDAHLPFRPAGGCRHSVRSDERLDASDCGTSSAREPDPERRLPDLDRHSRQDHGDSPTGRQHEDGQEDGEDQGQGAACGAPYPRLGRDDEDRGSHLHVIEELGRIGDEHADAAV